MAEEISAKSKTDDSANMTMTKEYLVLKGKYKIVRNGYFYNSRQTQAIAVKNILSMEYLTMRSKRALMIFIILMAVIVFGIIGMVRVMSQVKSIDRKIQRAGWMYEQLLSEDLEERDGDSDSQTHLKILLGGMAILVVGTVTGSLFGLFVWIFMPIRCLYISYLGGIIVVERRFYEKAQLDALIYLWKQSM